MPSCVSALGPIFSSCDIPGVIACALVALSQNNLGLNQHGPAAWAGKCQLVVELVGIVGLQQQLQHAVGIFLDDADLSAAVHNRALYPLDAAPMSLRLQEVGG